jgi:hypothetical protein
VSDTFAAQRSGQSSGWIAEHWPKQRPEPTILTAVKRLAGLLAAAGVVATASACGSSHRAHLSSNDLRVRSAAYSGHLYSVREVRRAFAALGLEVHRGPRSAPGLVSLVNDARLGPQHIPSPPRVVTVFVVTRRQAAENTRIERGRNTEVTRYANITVVSKPDVRYQVRAAVSALRWGTASSLGKPRRGLIVLGSSIDGIRLDESRTNVEKAFGVGRSSRRGVVSYFGGHLIVNYWFHDGLYNRVEYLETRWSGYRTRSGFHVGSSRRELRALYVTCAKENCVLLAGPWPDPVGTTFTIRHGKIADIIIGRLG